MGQLSDVQSFIDLSGRVKTTRALSLLLEQVTKDMGFDYFALVHHVDIRVKKADTASGIISAATRLRSAGSASKRYLSK